MYHCKDIQGVNISHVHIDRKLGQMCMKQIMEKKVELVEQFYTLISWNQGAYLETGVNVSRLYTTLHKHLMNLLRCFVLQVPGFHYATNLHLFFHQDTTAYTADPVTPYISLLWVGPLITFTCREC